MESDLKNSKGSEDYVKCAIKCQVRRSVEGMHSPQFAHVLRTELHVLELWNILEHNSFVYVYIPNCHYISQSFLQSFC